MFSINMVSQSFAWSCDSMPISFPIWFPPLVFVSNSSFRCLCFRQGFQHDSSLFLARLCLLFQVLFRWWVCLVGDLQVIPNFFRFFGDCVHCILCHCSRWVVTRMILFKPLEFILLDRTTLIGHKCIDWVSFAPSYNEWVI